MAFEYSDMLQTIKNRQWALADIDWDAPGAELITDEQRPKLKAFMSDLVWIENVGARGFAAMARKAPFDELAQIYTYFHAEEQRHANAELALMRRWGMVEPGEMPVPNKNIRLAIDWLDRYSDDLSLPVLGSVIPALETALDGALVKFLLDEVDDPVCEEVFRHINNDESRHLVVGFAVLDMLGANSMRRILIDTVSGVASPSLILGALVYAPLLTRMITNIAAMGLSEDKLIAAAQRYEKLGQRSPNTQRIPYFHVVKWHAGLAIDHTQPFQFLSEAMGVVIDQVPNRMFGRIPSWSKELTYEPVAK
ncbi:reductase [Aldersonia kunmingensis]|uniref:reductase n=1 Tax=Aldersonia kunmingensis TaxID=408066 RepID=UPI000831B56C|nr:reductase [Aldersonia kunmingensis]